MEGILSLVRKLQRACTALAGNGVESALPADWYALPSIAVVGDQSSGKSSVLESLIGKDFLPKGPGGVTCRPVVVHLRGIDEIKEFAELSHQPGKVYTDFGEVTKEIYNETTRESGTIKESAPIHLSIFSPNVVNVTLIDLPGLTKISSDSEEIENMVRAFIEKPNCIILVVCSASDDLQTSDAIKISMEVDPKGERTFGVLTKIDLMESRNDTVNILEGRSYRFPFHWVGVVNRSQDDLNVDMLVAKQREYDFFSCTMEYRHLAHRMGSEFLMRNLSRRLESFIKLKIPSSYLFAVTKIASEGTMKNKLEGYTLRAFGTFPTYLLRTNGEPHNMTFEYTVQVDGQTFVSATCHAHRKDAEEDAANVAYTSLMGTETIEGLCDLIKQDSLSKVSLLSEYLVKRKQSGVQSSDPVYHSSKVAVETQLTLWLSTVTLDGRTYIGNVARTKRSSAQNVALEATMSMLEDGDSLMIKVLLSKRLKATVPTRKSKKDAVDSRLRKKRKIIAADLLAE